MRLPRKLVHPIGLSNTAKRYTQSSNIVSIFFKRSLYILNSKARILSYLLDDIIVVAVT